MNLKAVFDSIIVKEIETDESQYGNIIIPDNGKQKHIVAEVLDVGPGKRSLLSGDFIETSIKKGDVVLLPSIGITSITNEGEDYIACDEGKVLAIIQNNND